MSGHLTLAEKEERSARKAVVWAVMQLKKSGYEFADQFFCICADEKRRFRDPDATPITSDISTAGRVGRGEYERQNGAA